MARQKKSAPAAPETQDDHHAAYAALMARLTAFKSEISAQAKSRPTADVPEATLDMAVDLIAQMTRLMSRAVEARGLPRLPAEGAITFSEAVIAFAQAHHAFETFGKRKGFDKPVADAEAQEKLKDFRNDVVRMLNVRIVVGIQTGYLVPLGNEYDAEKRELSEQFTGIVKRLGLIVDEEAFPEIEPLADRPLHV